MNKTDAGYVYILTNPSFREDWVKIGKSSRPVDVRTKELDNTAVPLPFEIYATMKTSKYNEAERLVHKYIERFTNLRIRDNREFFNVKPEVALDIFEDVAMMLDDAEIMVFPKIQNTAPVSIPAHTQAPAITPKAAPKTISQKETSSNAWYFPCNPKFFNIDKCVREVGYTYWNQGNRKFNVGDVLYLYISGKSAFIKYKAIVTHINLSEILPGEIDTDIYDIEYNEADHIKGLSMRIEYVGVAKTGKFTRDYLRSLGHTGFMSPNHLEKSIVDELDEEF